MFNVLNALEVGSLASCVGCPGLRDVLGRGCRQLRVTVSGSLVMYCVVCGSVLRVVLSGLCPWFLFVVVKGLAAREEFPWCGHNDRRAYICVYSVQVG